MAEERGFLHSPDIYLEKIAYWKKYENLEIDPESPADEIVNQFSNYAAMTVENIVFCILYRPRLK